MFETPWALRYKVDELAHKWNLLYSQMVGRALPGRPVIPPKIKAKVIAGRNGFRSWVRRLMRKPLVEALGSYTEEYNHQNLMYEKIRAEAEKALPSGERMVAPPGTGATDWSAFIPVILGIAGIATVASLIRAFRR